MRPPSTRRPVFLDSSGNRRRIIRRTGALLAVPAVGYVVLTASSLFGGPRLDTPLIPLPEPAGKHQPRPRTTPEPAAVQTIGSTTTPADRSEPTDQPSSPDSTAPSSPTGTVSSTPTAGATTPTTTAGTTQPTTAPPTPTVVPTLAPTVVPTKPPTSTLTPTQTPTATSTTTHGNKPTTPPPGQTKTPNKP